jgi:GAF domain-containing protein
VVSEDIATDPHWADYKELALSHGLHACWSTPIKSADGKVIGTFGFYYRQPRQPSASTTCWSMPACTCAPGHRA